MALSMTSTSVYGQAAAHANDPGRAPISVDSDWLMAKSPFQHADPEDPRRSIGWGTPLRGTSWRNRPYHAGWTVGALIGDSLIHGHVDQGNRVFGAYLIGWDFDHYWGAELRLGFSNLDLTDTTPMLATGSRTSRDQFWDLNLMYYPWGDARWRPFVSLGFGAGNFYFKDEVLPYYGGSTAHARSVKGVNHFMYWELMRRSREQGYRLFDFGRSKAGTGPFSFKKNFGFEAQALPYEYHLVKADGVPDLNPMNPKYRLLVNTWSRLPLPVANFIGPFLARSLG